MLQSSLFKTTTYFLPVRILCEYICFRDSQKLRQCNFLKHSSSCWGGPDAAAEDATAEDTTAEDGTAEDGTAELSNLGWTLRRSHQILTLPWTLRRVGVRVRVLRVRVRVRIRLRVRLGLELGLGLGLGLGLWFRRSSAVAAMVICEYLVAPP